MNKQQNNNYFQQIIKSKSIKSFAFAFGAILASTAPAKALDFNFTYAPGTTIDQMIGYEMAGKYWSNYLADDVTLNIFIESTNMLPKNVIGGALPGITTQNFQQFRQSLGDDITSNNDQLAYDNYGKSKEFSTIARKNNDKNDFAEIKGIKDINLTRANAKALGLINAKDKGLDAYILVSDLSQISRNISWDYYSPDDIVDKGSLDFFSVALHELGHTLGFVSGVDSPNWLNYLANGDKMDGKKMTYSYALDMFRLSSQSSDYKGTSDMSVGGKPIFSIDGGSTTLATFSSGTRTDLGGDGNQSSHWKSTGNVLGIMDPSLGLGQRRQITNLDAIAFDVIGWDLQNKTSNLKTVYGDAKTKLAQKIGVSTSWFDLNLNQAASRLTPKWLDADNDKLDDRGEALDGMITSSEPYRWGWIPRWLTANGSWQGWNASLQSNNNLSQDGFWQNMSWETLDEDSILADSESVPEPSAILGLLGLAWLVKGQKKRNLKLTLRAINRRGFFNQ